jgi:ribonuclease HII
VLSLLAGVDEAGRGPLAGSVVAAVVVIERGQIIPGVNDSKKLSEKAREAAFELIIEQAVDYAIAEASPAEIDQLNILQATMLAMRRAVQSLRVTPHRIRIDGNRCPDLGALNPIAEPLIGGDTLCMAIGAASILAKVTRDRQMLALDERYPEYGFARHKGYPTALHREILEQHGPCPEHRKSFRPVREAAQLRGAGGYR